MSSTQHQLIEQCATRLRGIVDALDNIHDTSPHRWSTDLDDVHSSAESLLALIKDQAPAQAAQGLAGAALAQPSPAPELERPEVVGYRSNETGMVYEQDYGLENPEALTTVAECDRIVGALRDELEAERKRVNIYVNNNRIRQDNERLRAELRYALARVAELETELKDQRALCDVSLTHSARLAELEKQEPAGWEWIEVFVGGNFDGEEADNGFYRGTDKENIRPSIEGTEVRQRPLYSAPVARAQHSVPEEFIGRLSEFLAQRGATGKALLRELRAMLAAELVGSASPSCKWTESSGIWETGCGQTWSFIEDGPAENGALFCHHCGGRLVLIKSDDQEDDGEPCPACMEHGCNGECAGHGAMGD
ncbi:TPA: hypothetical protein ACHIS3_000175 [Pseudomonas aeruginosa]